MTPRSLHSCHSPAEPPRCLGLTVAPYWVWDRRNSLSVWIYIIPNETKECYVISCLAGTDECAFNHSPQLAPGNLVRLDGPPALKNLNMVDTIPRTSPPPRTSTPTFSQPPRTIFSPLEHCPPPIRRINFALDGAGWGPTALDALSTTLTTFADVFSSSKLDYGECSLRPFEIKVPPGTQPIQSRTYRLNPVLSQLADAILDSYLAAGLIQHSTSPWSSPLVCVPKKSGGIRITVNYQKLNNVTEIPQIAIPRVDEVLDTLGGGSVFSVFDLFSGFTQLTIHPDTIPLSAFCTLNGLYEWLRMPQGAAGAPAWFVSVMRLVTAGFDNIRMYLGDAIGSDDYPLHHVATLATFFARLRFHQLKLSPDKSRIGAARVDLLGHVISADGVRPNDDRVAALTRMPMPTGIKQLRSLLGGLSYYRKFLPNMAPHPPDNGPSKKGRRVRFRLHNGGYRSCPSRGTRSIPNTCLSGLERHRHVSAFPPPLPRQHRWPRSHPRTRTTGSLHTPHRLRQPSHPRQ